MKKIFYLAVILALAARAEADPTRYVWRSFGGQTADLQPLFTWWIFVSQATNMPLDITGMDSNKLAVVSNLWTHLPARPLPEWCRVVAGEDQIMVAGSMWKVNATIEPAPMMVRHETIYLRDPPTKEIADYKQARAALLALQNEQNQDVASETYMESNIQSQADALRTNPAAASAPNSQAIYNQTWNLQVASTLMASNMTASHARTQYRDGQMAPLQKYLATFPDTNMYWLDHFAVRTGKQIGGVEVYDLGNAEGMTY
jgi:hypothetical protein